MNVHSPAFQADLATYNASMERSLEDKLFFLEHTAGAMTFVDFGCANGAVLKAVSERRKNKTLVGIDINQFQLNLAGTKVPGGVFAQDFEMVRELVEKSPGPRVAIFSSVLHESDRIVAAPLLSGLFDYIVIRDMGVTTQMARTPTPTAWLGAISKSPSLEDFEEAGKDWGTVADLAEFLLKEPYLGRSTIQTERELAENYPIRDVESLMEIGPTAETPYATVLFEHYSAPWIVDRVRQDFGFEFPYPTHFKMILKKVTL